MAGTRRLDQLTRSAYDRLRFPEGEFVVALSGGADSAALAYLSSQQARPTRAVHVNHGLSGSPVMERAAIEIAHMLELELDVRSVEVGRGPSPEGQARRVRYLAFEEATGPGDALLTAHTRDDQVETVVFNMIRGTGARGLSGIPFHRAPNIYRPALGVTRSEVRELATLAGLPFVDDPMNNDLSLSRNVVRLRIIPALAEMNPRLSESIVRFAGSIAADNEYLERLAADTVVADHASGASVAVGELFALPSPVRDRVLKTLLNRSVGSGAVSAERVQRVWEVATGAVDSFEVVDGAVARRLGSQLIVVKDPDSGERRAVPLGPGLTRHGAISFEVVFFDRACLVAPLGNWQAVFPRDVDLTVDADGTVRAYGEPAWRPGVERLPVAFYEPGSVGYLSVRAFEEAG